MREVWRVLKSGESNGYMNHSSIAYIVDASRMLMLNYCDQMKVQLQAKYASVELKQDLFAGEGMVYLDFDVSYKGTEIVDIWHCPMNWMVSYFQQILTQKSFAISRLWFD